MTEVREPLPAATVAWVWRGLLALTVITILATAFEIATVQHSHHFEQLIPWLALSVLTIATVLSLLGGWGRIAARVLAIVVLGSSIYGVIDHTLVNYSAGPLDQRFADTWETLPSAQQWWYAVTKTVGPAPTPPPACSAWPPCSCFSPASSTHDRTAATTAKNNPAEHNR